VRSAIQQQLAALRQKRGLPPAAPDQPDPKQRRTKRKSTEDDAESHVGKRARLARRIEKRRRRRLLADAGRRPVLETAPSPPPASSSDSAAPPEGDDLSAPTSPAEEKRGATASLAAARRALLQGLVTQDLRTGVGDPVKVGSRVQVHYVGTLARTGRRFDSCRSAARPFQFVVGNDEVVEGFEEGVRGMRLGGRRRIEVPAPLGYGASGNPAAGIPPDAALVFDVTLVGFY
jgi:FKBP-type peptidyl-prolyl cis-trans isomerase